MICCWSLWILMLLIAFAAAFGYVLYRSGLFHPIRVWIGGPPVRGTVKIAYKFGRGSYRQVGAFFSEIAGIYPQGKLVGVYYDDPELQLETNLRWCVGLVMEENGQRVVPDYLFTLLPRWKYAFHTFPKIERCIRSNFPYYGLISVLIAVKRVYPAIHQHSKKTSIYGFPMVEYYQNEFVQYCLPCDNQPGFYVPEAVRAAQIDESYLAVRKDS